jgi:transcription antitermination factor NusA-like protein
MVKVGHLVPVTIVKALPNYDSYLTLIAGTELLALLPKKYSNRIFKIGDTTLAAIFQMEGNRITLSQKSPQYIRKLMELIFAPLLREGKIQVKRAAMVSGCKFAKVAIETLNGSDPVKQCLPYLKAAKQYTDDTITLVRYSGDIKEYIVNALSPAPPEMVRKVIHFRSSKEADVYVDSAYVGLFLGKGGANVASAAKLTGVAINIKCSVFDSVNFQK